MTMVHTLTIQEYAEMQRIHPDIVVGLESGEHITLARVCTTCEGTGMHDRPSRIGGGHVLVNVGCPDCGGDDEWTPGTGYRLTPDGEAMRSFMQKFGGAR